MALTTHMVKTIPIPHEPGQSITFRMPNWTQVEAAKDARRLKGLKSLRETTDAVGADLYRSMTERSSTAPASTAVALVRDPWVDYDKGALLALGIQAWSYPEDATPENIAMLDPVTANWAGLTLVALVESGFDAALPTVTVNDDNSIEVTATQRDPLPFTSASTSS